MFAHLKKYNITDGLLLLILITLPLPEHWNSKALLIALIYVLWVLYKEFKIQFPQIGWFYIIFFVFAALSYFWSTEKSETLKTLVRLFPLLFFTLAHKQIFNNISLPKILRITAFVYLLYGFLWLILAYLRFKESGLYDTFFYHQLTSSFGASAIYIALIFGMLYLFLFYQILSDTTKSKPIDYFLAFFLLSYQILLSSKMIILLLILLSIILLAHFIKKKQKYNSRIVFGVLLAIIITFLLGASTFTKSRFKDVTQLKEIKEVFSKDYFGPDYYFNGLTMRLFQLRCFYEIEKDSKFNTLLGSGLKSSQSVLNEKYMQYGLYGDLNAEGDERGYFKYNFHNQYSQTLIELGIFGLIIILLFIYFYLFFPLKSKNILAFSVGLFFVIFAFSESYLLRHKGIVSFVLFPLLSELYTKKSNSEKMRCQGFISKILKRIRIFIGILFFEKTFEKKLFHSILKKYIEDDDQVLELGAGSDSHIRKIYEDIHITAIDSHKSSIEKANEKKIYTKYIYGNVLELDKLTNPKSYDVVVAFDLIEHLDKNQGRQLIKMMNQVARKRIIIFTPNGFLEQPVYDNNPMQEHISGWSYDEMKNIGFNVFGISGLKQLSGIYSLPKIRPIVLGIFIRNLSWLVLKFLKLEKYSFAILCIKETKNY